MNEIEQICEQKYCTTCCSCLNSCPMQCITMQENRLGQLNPIIDKEACINCGKCVKACPVNKDVDFVEPLKCYASWIEDKEKRAICASGGIATILSEYIISKLNGVVYGTRYNTNLDPICCRVETLDELVFLKGSKYVQCYVGNTYKSVKTDLKNGRFVLFIGTPCQISGLQSFLNVQYPNLLTCDLICHGVSPARYFKDELLYLKAQYKIENVTDCRFRGNDGKNYKFTLWDGNQLKYERKEYSQYYFSAFLKAISLHESCYSCQYAQRKRISDLTIGDFIGLGKDIPFEYSSCNVSVVILNTDKAVELWQTISQNTRALKSIERNYEEAVKGGISLRSPFPKHYYSESFRSLYIKLGWVKAIRNVLKKDIRKNIILTSFISYSWRIPRKIYRILLNR